MSLYAAFGLVLFFALGFGAGVGWAASRLAPDDPADAEPSGHGQFWDDLNRRYASEPKFRRGFDETTARIQEFDALVADEGGSP